MSASIDMERSLAEPPAELPVLVVDDDEAIRQLFVVTLRKAGFRTVEASNGREGLEMIRSHQYSAVLLDNHMPNMTGLEVIRSVRADTDTATLPIILITAGSDVSERVQGLQAGASDYLAKPVELDELVARVKSQLRGQALWMHKVEGHLRERAAITRALAQIKPAATPEATASVICFELSLLHQLSSVAMYAFGDRDLVLPIGRYGQPLMGETIGQPLDANVSRYLLDKCIRGPWTERAETLKSLAPRSTLKPSANLAFAPLVTDAHMLGLLVLVTEPANENSPANLFTHTLSAAIDFASVASGLLAPSLTERGRDQARHNLLDRVIQNSEFYPVFQPIVDLASGSIVGYETLTRFDDGMRPDLRFIEANLLGRGIDLELATLSAALEHSYSLPRDKFLSINVSPNLVLEQTSLKDLLSKFRNEVVLELTEHERIDDYDELRRAINGLGPNAKVSVDDAGSGFASLRHVLSLQPHFVKLDLSLVRDIHTDPARQALVAGFEYFAAETSARLIAEGIESVEDLDVLKRLDVELGQGYLLGRPQPLETLQV